MKIISKAPGMLFTKIPSTVYYRKTYSVFHLTQMHNSFDILLIEIFFLFTCFFRFSCHILYSQSCSVSIERKSKRNTHTFLLQFDGKPPRILSHTYTISLTFQSLTETFIWRTQVLKFIHMHTHICTYVHKTWIFERLWKQ